jgi:hypothetical protein
MKLIEEIEQGHEDIANVSVFEDKVSFEFPYHASAFCRTGSANTFYDHSTNGWAKDHFDNRDAHEGLITSYYQRVAQLLEWVEGGYSWSVHVDAETGVLMSSDERYSGGRILGIKGDKREPISIVPGSNLDDQLPDELQYDRVYVEIPQNNLNLERDKDKFSTTKKIEHLCDILSRELIKPEEREREVSFPRFVVTTEERIMEGMHPYNGKEFGKKMQKLKKC